MNDIIDFIFKKYLSIMVGHWRDSDVESLFLSGSCVHFSAHSAANG